MAYYNKLILIFLLLAIESVIAKPRVVDQVIAVVDGQPILQSELQSEKQNVTKILELEKREDETKDAKAFEKKVLEQIIEDRLLDREIYKMGLEATDLQVEQIIQNIMKENNIQSKEDFKRLLKNEGVAFEEFENNYRKRVSRNNYVRQVIQPKINIRPEEVEKKLQDLASKNKNLETRFELGLLLIPKADLSKDQVIAMAQEIRKKNNFSHYAKQFGPFSDTDGIIQNAAPKDLQEPIVKALTGLKSGEVSNPIEMDQAWALVKKINETQVNLAVSDEQREVITEQIFNERVAQSLNQTLTDLKNKALIEIFL